MRGFFYTNLFKKKFKGLISKAWYLLENYSWPGNVRELENTYRICLQLENEEYIIVESLPYKLEQVSMLEERYSLKNIFEIEVLKRYGASSRLKDKIASVLELFCKTTNLVIILQNSFFLLFARFLVKLFFIMKNYKKL